ncbi:hypothetical protein [Aureimonas leprariae]|uniref:hypothetical protein n=1 Tax=Plantimonas leprariae TaxID=2615207 RepID=UPI00192A5555|nr:hypothetical protein [Aureimonas leprariae]
MATVFRFLFLIPLGFLLACLAAAFALIWPFLGPDRPAVGDDPVYWIHAGIGFGLEAVQVGTVSFLPFAVFVVATEVLRIRSLILHALAGLAGAIAVIRLAYGAEPPHGSVQIALLVAGLAYALTYWLVAGRAAGGRPRAPQREGVSRIETAKPENTEAKT